MSIARRRRAVVLALGVAVVAAACGATSPPSVSPSPSVTVATPVPGLDPCALDPDAPPPATDIEIDPSLLAILPSKVEGLGRRPCPATATEVAADAGLAADVTALAVALYASLDDYAVAIPVRLRSGVYSGGWFRDWRDTFDAGVCEGAGGVDTGHSEFEVDGRIVHRATCRAGVTLYHVYVPDSDLIVSIHGVGPLDLGRRIVGALEE